MAALRLRPPPKGFVGMQRVAMAPGLLAARLCTACGAAEAEAGRAARTRPIQSLASAVYWLLRRTDSVVNGGDRGVRGVNSAFVDECLSGIRAQAVA
jgi:hypothetical protein